MTTQHTPGPVEKPVFLADIIVERDRLRAINAELLAALEELHDRWASGSQPPRRMWDAARAAIAKAEGRD